MSQCAVAECERAAEKRQMCNTHYIRMRRYGDPHATKIARYGAGASCSATDCDTRPIAKGLCKLHYGRVQANGATELPPRSPSVYGRGGLLATWPDRLWSNVNKTDSCWLWTGTLTRPHPHGYGVIRRRGQRVTTHRAAYELLVGPIPEGMQLDHLCRTRACCNPAHLEPVTPAENCARGVGIPAILGRQTHCKRGHEFTPENTRVEKTGSRRCLTCRRAAGRAHAAKKRAEAL